MAVKGEGLKTLLDWSKEVDPDGSTSAIAEVLSETNQIIDTAMFKQGNLPTGHRHSIRTGLPDVYWRLINKGTPNSKATSAQVDEACGILTARSHVDQDEAELNGNTIEFRMNESKAFIEAMGQEFAATMFYGSASNPEEFVGLAPRYSDLSANNSDYIISAGGSGSDNTSAWLIGWGEETICGIFPKGSKAGLSHEDIGLDDVSDDDGNQFRAYKDLYKMKGGIAVKDYRYGVRIPNIDVSDLQGLTGTQAITASTSIIKCMIRAIDRLPSTSSVKPYFYCNRTVASYLRLAALDKSSSVVTIEKAVNQFGDTIRTLNVLGIPVGINDCLTNAEAAVS